MTAAKCRPEDYIDFLVASPRAVSGTEAARVQPAAADPVYFHSPPALGCPNGEEPIKKKAGASAYTHIASEAIREQEPGAQQMRQRIGQEEPGRQALRAVALAGSPPQLPGRGRAVARNDHRHEQKTGFEGLRCHRPYEEP